MVQAYREDDRHTAGASAEHILVEEHDRHDIGTCREARMASREDTSGLRRLYLDLQVHRR